MGDIGEALERYGPGFLVPGSRPEQNVAAQTNSGHWWNRLFHCRQEEPPPPPPPPDPWDSFKSPDTAGAFDTTRFGNRTLEDIAGTLYNENSSLRAGDPKQGFATQQQLDNGATAMAHAILNGSFKGDAIRERPTAQSIAS